MKLTIDRDELLPAISLLRDVPQKKPVIPLYGMLRLTASSVGFHIEANNMEMAAASDLPRAQGGNEDEGDICVPAGRFADFVQGASGEIVLVATDKRLRMQAGRAWCEMPILPGDGFPVLEFHDPTVKFEVQCAALRDALSAASLPVDWQDTKHVMLAGVQMRGDSEYVNLVGITAARIILRRMVACAEQFKVLLPQGICGVLAKLGGATDTVHVELTDRLARFWCAGTEFISRLIDTDPQDYRPLLTRSARVDEPIRFTGADLMSAVQRAAPIINDGERERGLTLDVADGHMTIDGGIASVAEFHDEIEASGPAWHAQFQIGYLRDALTAFGAGDVEIHPSEHAIRLCPAGEAHDCAIIARLRE